MNSTDKPDIVFYVKESSDLNGVINHLLAVLRIPQVGLVLEGEEIPESVHTAIVVGPCCWKVDLAVKDVWYVHGHLYENTNCSTEQSVESTSFLQGNKKIDVVQLPIDKRLSDESKLETAFFWLCERLHKGSVPLGVAEYYEWLVTLSVLGLETNREDRLFEFLISNINRRAPETSTEAIIDKTICCDHSTGRQKISKKDVLKSKAALIEYSRHFGGTGNHILGQIIENFYMSSPNSYWLIAICIASYFIDNFRLFDEIASNLCDGQWYAGNDSIPLISKDNEKQSLCYSPLLIAWRYLLIIRRLGEYKLPHGIGREKQLNSRIKWFPVCKNGLFDWEQKRVSYSLLENWIDFHKADELYDQQIKLTQHAYWNKIYPLEDIWIDLLKTIQSRHQLPLVRISLWPINKKASISLRYDVDRPVTEDQIGSIIKIQEDIINAYCGSWYFFPSDLVGRPSICSDLNIKSQEIGLHLISNYQAMPGYGCTFHSAPSSEYWRGNYTVRALAEKKVRYMEFFSYQFLYPRPIILDSSTNLDENPWGLPIHFPLEGSTNDIDLSYFDNLKREFRESLQHGGHVIIGSHPDLNQNILIDLLRRESLENVWFDTIGNVVDRCQKIIGSNIYSVRSSTDERLVFNSGFNIPDLQAEVWLPNGKMKTAPISKTTSSMSNSYEIVY